jgi:hypothetical protein
MYTQTTTKSTTCFTSGGKWLANVTWKCKVLTPHYSFSMNLDPHVLLFSRQESDKSSVTPDLPNLSSLGDRQQSRLVCGQGVAWFDTYLV